MKLGGRNPVVWATGIATVVQGVLIIATQDISFTNPAWLLPALTALAGLFSAKTTTSNETLRLAHQSPAELELMADRAQGKSTGPTGVRKT